MLDVQFLGLVAVVVALVSRGSLLPVVTVTATVAAMTLAGEAAVAWYRRRRPPAGHADDDRAADSSNASDGDLHRWMAAVERLLRSAD
jgi:hypothetical protein